MRRAAERYAFMKGELEHERQVWAEYVVRPKPSSPKGGPDRFTAVDHRPLRECGAPMKQWCGFQGNSYFARGCFLILIFFENASLRAFARRPAFPA
jgi:hypothetical protein